MLITYLELQNLSVVNLVCIDSHVMIETVFLVLDVTISEKMARLKSPIKIFGGKNRMDLQNWILPILEAVPHQRYVEVFGGSGGLLIAKRHVREEIYNDLDSALYDFFDVISKEDLFAQFYRRVSVLPYSLKLFNECLKTWQSEENKVERVSKWFVMVRNLFGAIFVNNNSWSRSFRSAAAWLSIIKGLPEIHSRFQSVVLENLDWRDILEKYDSLETLFYLDPPYVHSTRRSGRYNFEMIDADHAELIERLLCLKGYVVLSGFENEIYKPLESNGWQVLKKEVVSNFLVGKSDEEDKRIEVLWIKPFKDKRKIFF